MLDAVPGARVRWTLGRWAPFAANLLNPEVVGGVPVHAIYGNNDGEKAGLKKILPNVVDGPLRVELARPEVTNPDAYRQALRAAT